MANAVRGSMISMSKPAILAIGASAWLIWTAPITTSRGLWHMHVEEEAATLGFHRTGTAGAERLGDRLAERACHGVTFSHHPVPAVAEIGHQDRRAARPALCVQGLQDKRIQVSPVARHKP